MGYSDTWRILEEIIIELRKKGNPVSESIMSDLKSARTLINLTGTAKSSNEIGPKIEQYLSSVEARLVTAAEKCFPPEKIDEWLRRLEGSSCEAGSNEPKDILRGDQRFIPGLPRDQKWVRVTPIVSLPKEKIEEFAQNSGLNVRAEKDGHLIVYGSQDEIRGFVKKMAQETNREQSKN